MSEQRIPLGKRSLATLVDLEAEAQMVQMKTGAHFKALLDHADIDAAQVADIKRDGAELVVILKDTVAPAPDA